MHITVSFVFSSSFAKVVRQLTEDVVGSIIRLFV